jgi:hypothetical protein
MTRENDYKEKKSMSRKRGCIPEVFPGLEKYIEIF